MQLVHERPDFAHALRGADAASARVNERTLRASFIVTPDALVEDWPVHDARTLAASDLAPLLALDPEVILIGTGGQQVFPPQATLAACLGRGIGFEAMSNAAAARTFNVLAGEGRRVVAGFVIA
ncbi:Mth938-like domain-containing protein [soil metagenome]